MNDLVLPGSPSVLYIDRKKRFNPKEFQKREGWRIEKQDSRALALKEVDLSKVQLVRVEMDSDGFFVRAGDVIAQFQGKPFILLDAKVLQTIWERDAINLIPAFAEQKKTIGGNIYISFFGTILLSPREERNYPIGDYWPVSSFLSLVADKDGEIVVVTDNIEEIFRRDQHHFVAVYPLH